MANETVLPDMIAWMFQKIRELEKEIEIKNSHLGACQAEFQKIKDRIMSFDSFRNIPESDRLKLTISEAIGIVLESIEN